MVPHLLLALCPLVTALRTGPWQAEAWNESFHADAKDFAAHLPAKANFTAPQKAGTDVALFRTSGRRLMSFHFVVTTSAESLSPLKQRVVESVLFHHPDARVRVHATLKAEVGKLTAVLAPLRKKHDVRALPYDLVGDCLQRLRGDESFAGLQHKVDDFEAHLPEWRETPYWPSQQSNLIRFCLLYYEGGVYLDTDALLVKPIPPTWRNIMGEERRDDANGAVLYFERGNSFVRECLAEILQHFKPLVWGANGPRLVTRIWHRRPRDAAELTVLPWAAFYPVGCGRAKSVFWELPVNDPDSRAAAELIERESTVVHFFFHAGLDYGEEETLGKELMRRYCILCSKDIFAAPAPKQTDKSW